MAISLDSALGIHAEALTLRAQRAELLAANLANADTPNYKAKDLDFARLLTGLVNTADESLRQTHAAHRDSSGAIAGEHEVLYRIPGQPTLDGNTVDTQVEQSKFLENALAYQASLTLLNQRISGLQLAIRGE